MFEFVHYRFVTAKKEEKMKKTDDKKGMIVPCAFAFSKTSWALQYYLYVQQACITISDVKYKYQWLSVRRERNLLDEMKDDSSALRWRLTRRSMKHTHT